MRVAAVQLKHEQQSEIIRIKNSSRCNGDRLLETCNPLLANQMK